MMPPTSPGPAPPPDYAPPPAGPYRLHGSREFPMENLFVIVGVVIGILIFAGFFSLHAMFLVPSPCTNPYGGCPTPTPAGDLIRTLAWVGLTALDLAAGLSVALAFIVGGVRSAVPDGTRRGLFVFATVFLGVWLVFGTTLLGSLLSSIRYL